MIIYSVKKQPNIIVVLVILLMLSALPFAFIYIKYESFSEFIRDNSVTELTTNTVAYGVVIILSIRLYLSSSNTFFSDFFRSFFDINSKSTADIGIFEKSKTLQDKVSANGTDGGIEAFTASQDESTSKYSSTSDEKADVRIIQVLDKTIEKLEKERQTISTRSSLNLVLGALVAGFGLYLIFYAVTFGPNEVVESISRFTWPTLEAEGKYEHFKKLIAESMDKVSHSEISLIGRALLGLSMQVLAYFFLNLYRRGSEEMKYYRNEITNIRCKQAALYTSLTYLDNTDLAMTVDDLMKTERNHVLQKGQSTVGLEQNRLDRTADNEIIQLAKDLIASRSAK